MKSKAEREQPILFAHGPGAGKAEAFAQSQHGFQALDGALSRMEGLEAADPGHVLLDPEMIALNALFQGLGDVGSRHARQQALLADFSDGRRVGAGAFGTNAARSKEGLGQEHLAEEALGGVEIPVGGESASYARLARETIGYPTYQAVGGMSHLGGFLPFGPPNNVVLTLSGAPEKLLLVVRPLDE